LAPLLDAIDCRVPRDDSQSIGLEDHNCFLVADARREAIDPGLIFLDGGRSTGRELGTVAERNIVGDQYGDRLFTGSAFDGALNILLYTLGSALGKPDGLWCFNHFSDQIGIVLVAS
jgi:hypothetical protein